MPMTHSLLRCLLPQHQAWQAGVSLRIPQTPAVVTDEEPTLITARNDGMINSFNPVQLSAWRANVDMQYIVSRVSSPPLSVVSEKATPLSKQCRSCSSTPWERETTLPKRPATCPCSSRCSRHHVTSSSSASTTNFDLMKTISYTFLTFVGFDFSLGMVFTFTARKWVLLCS